MLVRVGVGGPVGVGVAVGAGTVLVGVEVGEVEPTLIVALCVSAGISVPPAEARISALIEMGLSPAALPLNEMVKSAPLPLTAVEGDTCDSTTLICPALLSALLVGT